jgi:hypothetical protein
MGAFPRGEVSSCPVGREDRSVASLPLVIPSLPLGIVIKSGAPARKPVRFWAYMWAADEEMASDHWHQRVPSEHVA